MKEDQAARPRQPIRLALPFPPGRLVGSLGTLIFILIHIDEVLISCWLTLLSFCYAYSSCCTILFALTTSFIHTKGALRSSLRVQSLQVNIYDKGPSEQNRILPGFCLDRLALGLQLYSSFGYH